MVLTWEIIVLLTGFIIGYFLYTKFKFRSGGVLVIPFLAIYSIKFPLMLPLIFLASAITLLIMEIMFKKYIIYGRRLTYLSYVIGIIVLVVFYFLLEIESTWYSMLLPGMIAYNFHREINSHFPFLKAFSIFLIYLFVLITVGFLGLYFI